MVHGDAYGIRGQGPLDFPSEDLDAPGSVRGHRGQNYNPQGD